MYENLNKFKKSATLATGISIGLYILIALAGGFFDSMASEMYNDVVNYSMTTDYTMSDYTNMQNVANATVGIANIFLYCGLVSVITLVLCNLAIAYKKDSEQR